MHNILTRYCFNQVKQNYCPILAVKIWSWLTWTGSVTSCVCGKADQCCNKQSEGSITNRKCLLFIRALKYTVDVHWAYRSVVGRKIEPMAHARDQNFGQPMGTNSALQKLDILASRFLFYKHRKGNHDKSQESDGPHVSGYTVIWDETSKWNQAGFAVQVMFFYTKWSDKHVSKRATQSPSFRAGQKRISMNKTIRRVLLWIWDFKSALLTKMMSFLARWLDSTVESERSEAKDLVKSDILFCSLNVTQTEIHHILPLLSIIILP